MRAIKIMSTTLNVLVFPSLRAELTIAVATSKRTAAALEMAARPAMRRMVGDFIESSESHLRCSSLAVEPYGLRVGWCQSWRGSALRVRRSTPLVAPRPLLRGSAGHGPDLGGASPLRFSPQRRVWALLQTFLLARSSRVHACSWYRVIRCLVAARSDHPGWDRAGERWEPRSAWGSAVGERSFQRLPPRKCRGGPDG